MRLLSELLPLVAAMCAVTIHVMVRCGIALAYLRRCHEEVSVGENGIVTSRLNKMLEKRRKRADWSQIHAWSPTSLGDGDIQVADLRV